MAEATGEQRAYIMYLARSGEYSFREWIQTSGTRPRSDSAIREHVEASSQYYIFRARSQLRTDCLEAGWIQAWSEGSEKYAVSPPGFEQIAN